MLSTMVVVAEVVLVMMEELHIHHLMELVAGGDNDPHTRGTPGMVNRGGGGGGGAARVLLK